MTNVYNSSVVTEEVLMISKRAPLFVLGCFFFWVYVVQYPASISLDVNKIDMSDYGVIEWVEVYCYIFLSSVVFFYSCYFGMGKNRMLYFTGVRNRIEEKRNENIFLVVIVMAFFALWSYVMLKLKVGITIFSEFDALPFRLAGFLFYGRLLLQPIVVFYYAAKLKRSKYKNLYLILVVVLGVWVSVTSGSRLASLLFALPLLTLIDGKKKYFYFLLILLMYISVASLSRYFYLPYHLGADYIEVYANAEIQSSVIESKWLLPISYMVVRTMGVSEALLAINYGAFVGSIFDAIQNSIAYFMPYFPHAESVSIKQIYGLSDNYGGGKGLDFFSNYYYFFGGNIILYLCWLMVIGVMLGIAWRNMSLFLVKIGIIEGGLFSFVFLLVVTFEGRAFLLPYFILFFWFLNVLLMQYKYKFIKYGIILRRVNFAK
jgi:hypothetical protein